MLGCGVLGLSDVNQRGASERRELEAMPNALYYGDNLDVLRDSIATESVDLIYLDPPFNSQASYNVLFKGPSGKGADAQIEAFEDTWHWGEGAERAFFEVLDLAAHAGRRAAARDALVSRRKRCDGLSGNDGGAPH